MFFSLSEAIERVSRIGFQADGETFIVGPDVCYRVVGGKVAKVNIKDTGYVWVSGELSVLDVPDAATVVSGDALRLMEVILPDHLLPRFQLIVGRLFWFC